MTKRSETTGSPKGKPVTPPALPSELKGKSAAARREYHSRAEREAEIQRYVVLGTAATVAVIVLILVIAFLFDSVINPNRAVASINSQTINLGEFQKRVRFERFLTNRRLGNIVAQAQFQAQIFGQDVNEILSQDQTFNTLYSEMQIPDQLGQRVLDSMVDELLIRQAAAERGITVDPDQVQQAINEFFGYDPLAAITTPSPTPEPTITPTPFVSRTPSPTPTVTPTATIAPTTEATAEVTAEATAEATTEATPIPTIPPEPTLNPTEQQEEFNTNSAQFFDDLRSETGMSQDDINRYFETLALRIALRDQIGADITSPGPFVNARHILVETEEEAQSILAALQAGEPFAELAQAQSTDTGSGARGGELGWASVTNYVRPFADAVRSAAIGEIVGPVESEFGWHIIQVRAREDRELSADDVERGRESAFTSWLQEQKDDTEANQIELFDTWTGNVPDDPALQLGGV